jgi:hypothetical protein
MDYAEYVSEDPAALPRHRWNRGRRRATLRERENVDNSEVMITAWVAATLGDGEVAVVG